MQFSLFARPLSAPPAACVAEQPAAQPGHLLTVDAAGVRAATPSEIFIAARQAAAQALASGPVLSRSQDVRTYLSARLAGCDIELFAVLLLDSQNRVIDYSEPFRGTLGSCNVYPREVVRIALKHRAASVIVAHNHPSGTLDPSRADLAITRRLRDALALVDVRLVDHIIVAGSGSYSLAENGQL